MIRPSPRRAARCQRGSVWHRRAVVRAMPMRGALVAPPGAMRAPPPTDLVIETPSGSRTKYTWDPAAGRFRAKRTLPLGTAFPFDFGFVPGTRAADGDPLDALVLADAPLAVGVVVACRLLGVARVAQSEIGSRKLVRNDRLLAVPSDAIRGAEWRTLADLGPRLLEEIEAFFRSYIEREGRRFRDLGFGDARAAHAAIERSGEAHGGGAGAPGKRR
jgi:inorganic pyrophosphatase